MLYEAALKSTIEQIRAAKEVQVTMDGWKKRSAEHGTPLITVVVLLPDGGALFWKVCRTSPRSIAFNVPVIVLYICKGRHRC